MTAAIQLQKIGYAYGREPVLNAISISIARGDYFIIIGPNGSGKTTLLKLAAGIIRTTGGDVRIQGRSIGRFSRRHLARAIAYVPQLIRTDFPFTVMEVVLMGRSPHLGMLGFEQPRDIALAREAMGFTGVDHLAHRKLNALSGGECQRVFIARAICQESEIMLLDEPTASLDLAHQVRVMDLMEQLRIEKGITVVMVYHDVNLAAMYGNRILLLNKGRIAGMGTPRQVITYQTLEAVYGCKVLVDLSPLGDFPRVTLVPSRYIPAG